jgi:predicted AAA+ superfamily ATPase
MFIKRFLNLNLPDNQSCVLWGARKTGKSTFLKKQFPNSLNINLLQADIFQKYFQNPSRLREELITKSYPQTVIIDEIQKVPLLLDEVHYLIEELRTVQFILCGSSVRKLKSTGANLLGGRAWRYLFQPLCYPETQTLNWATIFNHGLIPDHYLAKNNVNKFLAAYIYDYILPEVQYEANIRQRDRFAKFLDVAAISNGEMIVYTNIARECGIDAKTVRTYFEIMEDMYLGYHLYPYRKKVKRQIITDTPKFYFFDTGVVNYLKKFRFHEMLGSDAGKAFEHYFFLELMAYKNLADKDDTVTYWRTKEGYEVDFIIQDNAFEIKITNNANQQHMTGLLQLSKEHDFKLHLICLETKKRVTMIHGKEITVWPIQEFLSELWSHHIWK